MFDYSGGLKNEPNKLAVQSVRQICNIFKKIKLPCTTERENAAFRNFLGIERDLCRLPVKVDHRLFDEVAGILISSLFNEKSFDKLICHHGPGSTAEKIRGNMKYVHQGFNWPKRLDAIVHMDEIIYPNGFCCNDDESEINVLDVRDELPVRVVSVPKTQKTPRIIAMEPVAMQMVQQGVKDLIVKAIEQSPYTLGHVNFTDQSINQRLAMSSSVDRKLATLDLSAASDRVHKYFIWRMLKSNKPLRNLVFGSRSRFARLELDGDVFNLRLRKFASMGSALCFPMEALFFYTLLICSRLASRNLQCTPRLVMKFSRDVYVYGDDIVIPSNEVDAAISYLENFGNKVGRDKSFWKGAFRESCGVDAFSGYDVTPIYVRVPLHSGKRVPSEDIVSLVSTSNLLKKRLFNLSAGIIRDYVEERVGSLPIVGTTSPGLGWWSGSAADIKASVQKYRFDHRLQRVEVKTLVPFLKSPKSDKIDGYAALTKCLLNLERRAQSPAYSVKRALQQVQATSEKHLDFSGSLGVLALKRRWVQLL